MFHFCVPTMYVGPPSKLTALTCGYCAATSWLLLVMLYFYSITRLTNSTLMFLLLAYWHPSERVRSLGHTQFARSPASFLELPDSYPGVHKAGERPVAASFVCDGMSPQPPAVRWESQRELYPSFSTP